MNIFFLDYKYTKVFDKKLNLLWEIQWVVFDIDYEKIIWFSYKKKFLKTRFFLLKEILLKDETKIILSKIHNEKKYYYELIWKQVKDIENNILWYIFDVEFDILFKLKNIKIDIWYDLSSVQILSPTKISIKRNYIDIEKKSILKYEKNYIIIENKNTIKENKKTLENISKIFINIPIPSYNINL